MKNLTLTIKGVSVDDTWLRMILAGISDTFNRDDLLSRMKAQPLQGLALDEATRPILQHLKRQGVISYSRDQKSWRKTDNFQASTSVTLPIEPNRAFLSSRHEGSGRNWLGRNLLATSVAWLVSACLIGALMIINAGFAWNFAEDSIFRLAFTIGFIGLDGLRPLLMALALSSLRLSWLIRMLAAVVAVGLAPASILSSTSVISSALIMGTETLTEQADQNRQMSSLNAELNRLEIRVSQAWADYRDECERGGCGDIADGLKAEALELESQIRTARDQIGILQAKRPLSTFTSRTVETLQTFGFQNNDLKWLMPIFLALTLEIAALLGPALLLQRRP